MIAQGGDGFLAHVANALDGLLIILCEQQHTDKPDDGSLVGEDADFGEGPGVHRLSGRDPGQRWLL